MNQKGLACECSIAEDVPDALLGDAARFAQILNNLLGNAVKFTESGRISVLVSISEQHRQGITLRCQVIDTGIGIPPESQVEIFNRFSQADTTTTRKYGGTGLGLAIAKHLVELMGGKIGLESRTDEGSTFWFTCRFAIYADPLPRVSPTEPVKPLLSSRIAGINVLLVEDNEINQEIGIAMLESLGCTVLLAESGNKAIELLGKGTFDLIFMDCQMPDMDGYEVTGIIRRNEQQADLSGSGHTKATIIALTANALTGDREKCLAAGMDDYLAKPFTLQQINKIMSRFLGADCITDANSSGISGFAAELEMVTQIALNDQFESIKSNQSVIDHTYITNITALQQPGMPNILDRLITKYLETFPTYSEKLCRAVIDKDTENLRSIAHIQRSSSANLGATALAELFGKVEQIAQAKSTDGIAELLEKTEIVFVDVKHALSDLKSSGISS
jgi:CheY-like chemotaxis protein/HPt (histidine-containing phosphotransfer) domain-containing protein